MSNRRKNVSVFCVDVSEFVKNLKLYARSRFTVEMYYRLIIPNVLDYYSKAIYIDCDVVCEDDISKLYDSVLFDSDELMAGVKNIWESEKSRASARKLGFDADSNYINSGVLVLNCSRLRDEITLDKFKYFIENNKNLILPDQDTINVVCKNRIKILDIYWNLQKSCEKLQNFQNYADGNVGIIHYTTGIKPWKHNAEFLPFNFWKYARNSAFYETILERYLKCEKCSSRVENANYLNNYFSENYDNSGKIIIVSAKDEASKYIDKILRKDKIGLSMKINHRDSYIGIVDVDRKFKYERSSQNTIKYIYTVNDVDINIVSGGFNSDNCSYINFKSKEFSKKKRGLNFVILDSKSLNIIDSFNVDTFEDESLKMIR